MLKKDDINCIIWFIKEVGEECGKYVVAEIKSVILLAFDKNPSYTCKYGICEYRLPNGNLHRTDGPAYCGFNIKKYYINGKEYSPLKYWNKQKHTKHADKIVAYILGNKNKEG